ncbi:MAG: DegT/DnrJ/EryC1/StrS family aminotransferase [Micavibrio aeruginosavorus]|uniref:DegT/DnrJ/EryC1/StrS family aminotransferase n=1 Tax=Micavibrio aeruginosavorus TaxID=349221 RepID=A0A7T5UI54_9BACT|nr:MAG: DegT/DnrJ/EryC1/StrS family aminotransferase [Micavibrio aeruginosavorus]
MTADKRLSSPLALHGGNRAVRQDIPGFTGIGSEEKQAVIDFLDRKLPLSGFHGSARPSFFGGPEVQAFEAAWRDVFKCKHAVSVNSATSGLMAAMGAIGIEPGDEVIVPPYTMSATVIAPLIYGGIPVFVDVEDEYFCLNVEKVRQAITPRTKAILTVNLWGHPAALRELRRLADEKGLYLVEDNAQALSATEDGRYAGTIGHIGVFSMNVHKHIQSGEGGVCVTEDDHIAQRLQLIRNHGENVTNWLEVKDIANIVGFNFRQTEIGAVIARAQLKKLDPMVRRCREVAQRLSAGLKDMEGIIVPKVRNGCTHSYFMWSVRYQPEVLGVSRERFVTALQAEGVPVAQGYVPPLYRLPLFQKRTAIGTKGFPFSLSGIEYRDGLCPVTERLHEKEIIQYQPVAWDPSAEQIEQMIEAFRKVHKHIKDL